MTDIVKRLRAYKSESWGSALKDIHDAAVEIERPRSLAQHETDAAEAYKAQAESLRDCRTCRNYYQYHAGRHPLPHRRGDCRSVLRCVDGAAYQRAGAVRLWEAKD